MKQSEPIERVHAPTKSEFEKNYVARGKPVIITGVIDKWQAVTSWEKMDYIRSRVGGRKVPVQVHALDETDEATRTEGVNTTAPVQGYKLMETNEFLDLISESNVPRGKYYIMDVHLQSFLPELLEDTEELPYLEGFVNGDKGLHYRTLFFGRDNFTKTHVHFNNHTLVCHIVGEKRWKLFAPDQSAYLYPAPLWSRSENPFHSRINIDDPDLERFPRFRNARFLDVKVKAGELLYIPTFWWHAVYSPGLSIAIGMIYPNQPKWYFRYPRIGMRCFTATLFKALANRLKWRNDTRDAK